MWSAGQTEVLGPGIPAIIENGRAFDEPSFCLKNQYIVPWCQQGRQRDMDGR